MISHKYVSLSILVFVLACVSSWRSSAALGQVGNFEGRWLVLKNGGVIEGLVERKTDHYSVQTPQGSRLVIPFSKADFAAESLNQAYWKRLANLPRADVQQHEGLFHWCLNHQLWEESKNQVEVLKAMGVGESRIAALSVKIGNALIDTEKPKKTDELLVQNDRQSERQSFPKGSMLKPVDVFENIEPVFQSLPSLVESQAQSQSQLADAPQGADEVFASRFENNRLKGVTEIDLSAGKVVQVDFQEDLENTGTVNSASESIEIKGHSVPQWVPPVPKKLEEPVRLSPSNIQSQARQLKPTSPTTLDGSLQTIGDIPSLKEGEKKFKPRDEFDPEIFNRQLPSSRK